MLRFICNLLTWRSRFGAGQPSGDTTVDRRGDRAFTACNLAVAVTVSSLSAHCQLPLASGASAVSIKAPLPIFFPQVSSARPSAPDPLTSPSEFKAAGVSKMAGTTIGSVVLLSGLCLLAAAVHGVSVGQSADAWQFSNGKNTVKDSQEGHLVPDNGFQYRFEHTSASRNPDEFSENLFSDVPEQLDTSKEVSSFGDGSYVYDAKFHEDNAAPYDYSNSQFSARQRVPASKSFASPVPEEKGAGSHYVYDASAGDSASFSTPDTQRSSGDQTVTTSDSALPTYAFDAHSKTGDDTATFSTRSGKSRDDQVVHKAEHTGPVSFYTPASNADGAFHFYDPRSADEKKVTSVLDVDDPATTAQSFAEQTDARGDSTIASTAPIFESTKSPQGTYGCPNTYWVSHVKQWPKELQVTTPVSKAFGGLNLRKNLEIVYGTTTLFQALMDTRAGPYSLLLSNAAAALLNAYARPAYSHKPAEVSKLFHSALASKTAAAAQALKFEEENHAFGDSECK